MGSFRVVVEPWSARPRFIWCVVAFLLPAALVALRIASQSATRGFNLFAVPIAVGILLVLVGVGEWQMTSLARRLEGSAVRMLISGQDVSQFVSKGRVGVAESTYQLPDRPAAAYVVLRKSNCQIVWSRQVGSHEEGSIELSEVVDVCVTGGRWFVASVELSRPGCSRCFRGYGRMTSDLRKEAEARGGE